MQNSYPSRVLCTTRIAAARPGSTPPPGHSHSWLRMWASASVGDVGVRAALGCDRPRDGQLYPSIFLAMCSASGLIVNLPSTVIPLPSELRRSSIGVLALRFPG